MALKQADRVLLEGLQDTITTLVEFDIQKADIEKKLAEKIKTFELATNTQFKFNIVDGKAEFSLVDLRSDYVRTRHNTEKTMTSLKAKINGLPIDVKIKKDDTSFTNAEIVESLHELANVVSAIPEELTSESWKDWPRRPGEETENETAEPTQSAEPAEAPAAQGHTHAATPVAEAEQTENPAPVTSPQQAGTVPATAPAPQQAEPSAPVTSPQQAATSPGFPGEEIDSPLG